MISSFEIHKVSSMKQLVSSVQVGTEIIVLEHWIPRFVGFVRVVTKAQKNGYWYNNEDGQRAWVTSASDQT